jgi:hypothetical protein
MTVETVTIIAARQLLVEKNILASTNQKVS